MRAATFWSTVTADEVDLLGRVVQALEQAGIDYCVVGGQAVNAYVEPLVSLDLDLALAAAEVDRLEGLFGGDRAIELEPFAHRVNLSSSASDLRVQFQTDPCYEDFPARAERRAVLGKTLPVATLEDTLRGKVWAAQDPTRRGSRRLKDLAEIARLLEAFPDLRRQVPGELLERLA